jgi:hypothetical protein
LELLTSDLPPHLIIFFWGSVLSSRNLDDLSFFSFSFFPFFLLFHSFFGVLESIFGILTTFLSFFLILQSVPEKKKKNLKEADSTNRNRASTSSLL